MATSAQFTVPVIFRGVNQLTPTIGSIQSGINQLNGSFARLQNTIGESSVGKKLNYLTDLGKAMLLIGSARYAIDSMIQYQKQLGELRSVTGATDEQFKGFESTIAKVAKATKVGMVDISKSFTTIANNMPQLLGDAEGLGKVSYATMLLGKAAVMDYGKAAESLTNVMNVYNVKAADAVKITDMMAAGAKYGSARIEQIAGSLGVFGGIAKLTNISLKESVALIELVSKNPNARGEQGGRHFNEILSKLAELRTHPENLGKLSAVGIDTQRLLNQQLPIYDRLMTLRAALNTPTGSGVLAGVFGSQSNTVLLELLGHLGEMPDMLSKLEESGVAMAMAERNTNTLIGAFNMLKTSFQNIVLSSTESSVSMRFFTNTLGFVANNLSTITNMAVPLGYLWLITKGITGSIWLWGKGQAALNTIMAFTNVFQRGMIDLTLTETAAIKAQNLANWYSIMGWKAWALTIGAAAGILGLFALVASATISPIDSMNDSIGEMNDNLGGIKPAAKEASDALKNFREEQNRYKQFHNLDKEIGRYYDKGNWAMVSLLVAKESFMRMLDNLQGNDISTSLNEPVPTSEVKKEIEDLKNAATGNYLPQSPMYPNTQNNINGSININLTAPAGTNIEVSNNSSFMMPSINQTYTGR